MSCGMQWKLPTCSGSPMCRHSIVSMRALVSLTRLPPPRERSLTKLPMPFVPASRSPASSAPAPDTFRRARRACPPPHYLIANEQADPGGPACSSDGALERRHRAAHDDPVDLTEMTLT